jgi:hypothetical protein
MYSFLQGTAEQYMTHAVTTVTRRTTMRELEALFEQQLETAQKLSSQLGSTIDTSSPVDGEP